MISNYKNQGYARKLFNIIVIFTIVSLIFTCLFTPTIQSKEFLPPNQHYSVNYYESFGKPDIYASVLGDTEFKRGDTVQIEINLANKGILNGFKSVKNAKNETERHLAQKEMEYEKKRTVAQGIKTNLTSTSPYIDVDSGNSGQVIEKLASGETLKKPLKYTIDISDKTPAGEYILKLPITYEYQSEVRMTGGEEVHLGISDLDHTTHYRTENKTIDIPIAIKKSADFQITQINSSISSGSTGSLEITYKNTGELVADDATARIVAMRPLSIEDSQVNLGRLEPGESKTANFEATASSDAVAKKYVLNSEIRYYDDDRDIAFSDNLKTHVNVTTAESRFSFSVLVILTILALVIYLIVDTVRTRNKGD
ncbi:MAG: COG1361 S-layer family protein [Methanohalobium sp.]|uniref:COG1361 S-layer family protein n=1 Tax=Methanohalobium sp. TaxID=2837493 RepID=UPI00397E6276